MTWTAFVKRTFTGEIAKLRTRDEIAADEAQRRKRYESMQLDDSAEELKFQADDEELKLQAEPEDADEGDFELKDE